MDPTIVPDPSWSDELQTFLRFGRRALRKWRWGLASFLAVLAATVAVILFWPRQYRSEAVVYYQEGLQWTSSDAPNPRRMGQRFRDSLLARSLLTRVIESVGLYPRLVKAGRLAEAVEEMRLATAFRIDQGDVYTISFAGDSPEEAQRVTARLTELLIEENARMQAQQAQVAGNFLDTERQRSEESLAEKEAAMLRFLVKHPQFATEQGAIAGLGSARGRREPEAAPGADRESEALAALRREEDRLRRQLASPGQGRGPQDPTLVSSKEEAEAKLREAQRDLTTKRAAFTEQHPDVKAAEALLRQAQAAYQRAAAALEAAEPRVLTERLDQVRQEIAAFRRLQAQARPAAAAGPMTGETARKLVDAEAEWIRLNREVVDARERFQQLEARRFTAAMTSSLAASGQAAQIVVIDPAFLPVRPVGTSRTGQLAIGLALALVGGLGAALVRSLQDDVVQDGSDLERLRLAPTLLEVRRTDLPRGGAPAARARAGDGPGPPSASRSADLHPAEPRAATGPIRARRLATVPAADPSIVLLTAPTSPAAAAFRVLRHRLRERGDPRAVVVTCPERGEGKSMCATNLALALAEGGRARVLLLEANVAEPAVARLLGFEPPVCAAAQLEAHRTRPSEPWDVVELGAAGLHVLAAKAGTGQGRPLDTRAQAFVEAFLAAGYDHVVIDAPPVVGTADVNLLQEAAAGVLLCVFAGVSRSGTVQAAVGQLGTAKLLGFGLLGT